MPWVASKMFYVYFLKLNNSQVYTGCTNDLKRRVFEHQNGKVFYTKARLPLKLIGYEAYLVKEDAFRREKFLKSTEGKKLFRKQYKTILTGEVA